MAVVQISKIQIRRGKKNQGTGLPQLASGELAWAIDTQELYIGNGAVGEGAPAVGNTKILTEKDSILDLLEQYQYKASSNIQTGIFVNSPVKRTVLAKLDEGAVNAASFGISGLDSAVDQTAAIQNALYSLYLPNATLSSNRVTLEFDPGTYTITGTVYVPSNVRIVGSGADRTIFNFVKGGINQGVTFTLAGTSISGAGVYANLATTTVQGTGTGAIVSVAKTGAGTEYTISNTTVTIVNAGSGYANGDIIKVPGSLLGGANGANDLTITLTATGANPTFNTSTMFEFINDTSTRTQRNVSPTSFANQPKNILFESVGLRTNRNDIVPLNFRNVRDSEFNNITITGTWTHGVETTAAGLDMFATSFAVTCQRNKFSNVFIEGFAYGVSANSPIINNTFDNCYFKTLNQGVRFGVGTGSLSPRKNTISNSFFDTVSQHGILIDNGFGNRSRGNTFINVGNDGGGFSNNRYSVIKFTSSGNTSLQDNFDRAQDLGQVPSRFNTDKYITEVEGVVYRQETEPVRTSLDNSPIVRKDLVRLPLNSATGFNIDYVFRSNTFNRTRNGTLSVIVNRNEINQLALDQRKDVQLADNYEFLGEDDGDLTLKFYARVENVGGIKSLIVSYTYYTNVDNDIDQNTFTYTYTVIS